ncbi:MAG: amidase [Anaerolineae bacterium]
MHEMTIQELQARMAAGTLTSRGLVEMYLARIAAIDRQGPTLNAIIEINPDALAIAAALDAERRQSGARGPLHGIPILLKDNIDTGDQMQTTAGSLALVGPPAPADAPLVSQLRQAGAVILGKTNLSEWANFRSSHSTSGWSSRGGQTRNPYALDRNPSGSSSGSAVAVTANLCAVAVGTETDGSITSPASVNGVVGIKPTVGLVSRRGIIPIAHSQDTAGPLARCVADAAILLGSLTAPDPGDPATLDRAGPVFQDYTPFLDRGGLAGARIGVARNFFGFNEQVDRLLETCLEVLRHQGAEVVDPAPVLTAGQFEESEALVLLVEFKADLNAYLAQRGPTTPVQSLAEIIEFNERHAEQTMPFFGQDLLHRAQAQGPLTGHTYQQALAINQQMARDEGIDATLRTHRLDAIVAATCTLAWLTDPINGDHYQGSCTSPAAVAGYPHITVPAGLISGLPIGLSFFGGAYQEPTLIRLAYAFEQATLARRRPEIGDWSKIDEVCVVCAAAV